MSSVVVIRTHFVDLSGEAIRKLQTLHDRDTTSVSSDKDIFYNRAGTSSTGLDSEGHLLKTVSER